MEDKIIHKDLSYRLNGLLFRVHNELGKFCREKQYGDALEKLLTQEKIKFEREKEIPIELVDNKYTNKVDFMIESKVLLDLKAKPVILKEDYFQMKRYLNASGYKLGLIVNFRNNYLKPTRVLKSLG